MVESGPPSKPGNDIFTVLVITATVFVVLGTVFLAVRSNELFGTWLPVGGT